MSLNPVICAIDEYDLDKADSLAALLRGRVALFKLGLQMFCAFGRVAVDRIAVHGIPVFLDVKLHDIPNTVSSAVSVLKNFGVAMLTVHALGGQQMLKAAFDQVVDSDLELVSVTVLTSMSGDDMESVGLRSGNIVDNVLHLVDLSLSVGITTIVCSASETACVREKFGSAVKIINPGIRLPDQIASGDVQDQKRFTTPKMAIMNGADYLVVGRPITRCSNPILALEQILHSIQC